MYTIFNLLYNVLLLPLLFGFYLLNALFVPKVRRRFRSVRESMQSLDKLNRTIKSGPRIWVHASSMGEFEQAKPVIELLKKQIPELVVIVSFFSSSGYDNQKAYAHADAVIFLPFDTKAAMRRLVRSIDADLILVMRYDLWWNMLHELQRSSTRAILLNATFSNAYLYTLPIFRRFYSSLLECFDTIVCLNEIELSLFKALNIDCDLQLGADTRYDRLIETVDRPSRSHLIPHNFFHDNDLIVVLGSVWMKDVEMVMRENSLTVQLDERIRFIIVPHETSDENLSRFERAFASTVRLSELGELDTARHILVDSIGKLLELYSYAHGAYVGGGFGAGIHSISEPAAYGLPICCGPSVERNADAVHLLKLNSLRIVNNYNEFREWQTWLCEEHDQAHTVAELNYNYIRERSGMSMKVAERIAMKMNQSTR